MQKWMIIAAILAAGTTQIMAQRGEVFSDSSAAIRGYDPVGYFTQNKAVKGDRKFVHEWKNTRWYFSSQQNMDAFVHEPEKYAPQYGGYCAYGCSNGYKAPTDPQAWTIVNGKLYLNYNVDVRSEWSKNKNERIEKADKNWEKIKNK
jgi:YHS domain-containing protein